MKRFNRILIGILPILLSGCYSASFIEFDGLQPAEVVVPATVHSLTVVARFDLDSTARITAKELNRLSGYNRDSAMSKQMVLGCSDALVESPRFELFYPVLRRDLIGDFTDPSTKIPWDKIAALAGDPPKDGVLLLEKAVVEDTLTHAVLGGWLNSYQYTVFTKSYWRLYRLNDFQSNLFTYSDTITFDIEAPLEFISDPGKRLDMIREAMYESGTRTARRLAPWWTSFDRYYFPLSSFEGNKSQVMLQNGQWQEAAEYWRPYTESSKKRIAAKACFNMALTCEMANNIPTALEWIRQSEILGMNLYYISVYRTALNRRKAETVKLDEQMK